MLCDCLPELGPAGLSSSSSHSRGPDPKTRLLCTPLPRARASALYKSTPVLSPTTARTDHRLSLLPSFTRLHIPSFLGHSEASSPSDHNHHLKSAHCRRVTSLTSQGHSHRISQHSASSSAARRLLSAQNLLCSGGSRQKYAGSQAAFFNSWSPSCHCKKWAV